MSAFRKRKSVNTDKDDKYTDQPRKRRKLINLSKKQDTSDTLSNNDNLIEFNIRSWCWMDSNPYKSYIKLTNNSTSTHGLKIYDLQQKRGHRIVVINGINGNIEQSICFDTWADIYSGIRLKIFLKTLQFKPNKWVIIIIHDSGYNINTEAAWNQLQKYGLKKINQPTHRESFIFIFSTNTNYNWWQYIQNSSHYFNKKYEKTIHSCSKRKLKKLKKNKKINKDQINISYEIKENIITDQQLKLLQSFGKNVFFQKKCKSGKGALMFKGFLPRMKPVPIEDSRIYRRILPVELALKTGIKPCDTDTNKFYCVSCLNNNDYKHMLICMDSIHENDDNARNILPQEKELRQKMNETQHATDEINYLFRVKSCGQAYHIYCVTYPDNIWRRWCNFMGVEFDGESDIPSFVEMNIKKQQKIWNARDYGDKTDGKDGKKINYYVNDCDSENENENEEYIMDTGNIDYYDFEYSTQYQLTPLIRNLSEWYCHIHRSNYHHIHCKCGNPMVEQLCINANGETKEDLKTQSNSGFKGLYCNNYSKGCKKRIQPNEIVFRCMNGARCTATNDGWDWCLKCMVKKIDKLDPKILCLCGEPLILGTINDVRAIFADKMSKKSSVENGNTNNSNNKEIKPEHIHTNCNHNYNKINIQNGKFQIETNSNSNGMIIPRSFSKLMNNININKNKDNDIEMKLNLPSLQMDHDINITNNNNNIDNNNINNSNNIKKTIKKASTYRCSWCLKKFESKTESVYYCTEQNSKCCRIIKNHFIFKQPFILCIGCIVQSNWMTQQCICGCNLHCRLLIDWIHNDNYAYNNNIIQNIPERPNGQWYRDDIEDKIINKNKYKNPIDFYIQTRINDNEHNYWNELSVKYVNCAKCDIKITAYQFVFLCNNNEHSNGTYYLCGKCAIKNRSIQSLYPSCNEKVEICLLFIAHDGVSQATLWEKWLAENESIRNKFGIAVQCNNFFSLKTGKKFAEKYRIDVQRPTSWGKLLVPLTIQKSIQISLTKYPKCKRFYIISGREIPLVNTKHLYKMPNKTQLMAKKIGNSATATRICKKRIGKLLQWYSHHAAMCLSREHAELISVTPWKEYFSEFDNVYDNIGAPDEFLFGTTLNAFGVNMRTEIWREVTTDFELPPKSNVRHPILFDSLNKPVAFWIVNETMDVQGKETKSLKELLMDRYKKPYRLWGYGPCFFRKISQNVLFKEFIPWKLCKMMPPIIDIVNNINETITYRKELDSLAYMDEDEIEEKEEEEGEIIS